MAIVTQSGYTQPPNLDEARKFISTIPGVVNSSWEPLYDRQTYPAAGATQFTFFQQPIGQSGRVLADTNMTLAGTLSTDLRFLVLGISVEILLSSLDIFSSVAGAEDLFMRNYYDVITGRSALTFTIGAQPQLQQGPLTQFPPTTWIDMAGALSQTLNATEHGMTFAQLKGKPYQTSPILITSNQNFSVTLDFPTAIAVNTAGAIICRLHGYKYRSGQ